jgi:multidrug efflux pump subunit AcrA (membrane-fusion protein)
MTIDDDIATGSNRGEVRPDVIAPAPGANLPVVLPPEHKKHGKPPWLKYGLLLVPLSVVLGAGYWWNHSATTLPPGIAFGNGRLEADEIDIDTKFAGRIATLSADEGDMVKAGAVVAVMDTRDLEASLQKVQSVAGQAQRALDEARANLDQQQTQVRLAKQELDRTSTLVSKGYATTELLDQRRQQMDAATVAFNAATAKVAFIASQAQFTPKAVETKDERDKLMFRPAIQLDVGSLALDALRLVRSGDPLPRRGHYRGMAAIPCRRGYRRALLWLGAGAFPPGRGGDVTVVAPQAPRPPGP